jgi:hypothetical protein
MKTLKTLFVLASLFTVIAWFSLQGVSNATIRPPQAAQAVDHQKIIQRRSAAVRSTLPPKLDNKPAAPSKPKAPSPFQVALEAADLCEVSRLLNASYQSTDVYAAIIATMSPSPAVQEAFGTNGPMMVDSYEKTPKFAHPASEVLWALKAGGMIYAPVSRATEDPKAARELILSLEKKNPGNAFFPFLRLTVEEKLGLKKEQLVETAKLIATGSSFDSGLGEIDREFKDAYWQSPAMHYVLSYVYSGFSPSYYSSVSTLRRLSEEKEFDGSRQVAELMMQKGMSARRSYTTGEYDIQQYNTGKQLVQGLAGYPEWNELEAEKNQKPQTYPTAQPWVTDEVTGERRCDPGPYESFFYEARENR